MSPPISIDEFTGTPTRAPDRFYGKYRGRVNDNRDPEGRGRLAVSVPEVRGEGVIDWALPCVPFAGDGVGFFALPPVGASVWVEYEGGNLHYPIWSGCFWARGEIAASDAVPEVAFLRTQAAAIRIDAAQGEVTITIDGAAITLSASEIRIEAPRVVNSASGARTELSPGMFDMLQGALRVV